MLFLVRQFCFGEDGAEDLSKAEMHTFDDRVGLGIFHCSGNVGDSHVLEELLEGFARKFAAIVVDAADRARITI